MKPVDLGAEREKRAPRCRFCGSLKHAQPDEWMQCPRIDHVDFDKDGGVCGVDLLPDYDEPEETPPAA